MAPQTWLVTGKTSGFGLEFVKKLLARGEKVIATARDTTKISHFKLAGASILKLDLFADQAEFNRIAEEAIAIYGGVDVVVNNVGYSHFGTVEDDRYSQRLAQTISNPCLWNNRLSARFSSTLSSTKSRTFVFVGSTAAWAGIPTLGAYCSSKSALRGAVETLQLETSPFGIRTLLVEPGFFRTELLNANSIDYADTKISDYKPLTEKLFTQFKGAHHQQPGDPAKGVQRIIDTVKGENDAAGKEFPVSLALGSDAVEQIRKKCQETLRLLEEWEVVSSNTNYN